MRLTILGSGTCVPSLKRNAPSNFLKIGDIQILVDCGSGTLLQLQKAGLTHKDIDVVCISHYHPDHIADLNPLIQALNHTPCFDRKKDLVLIGPPGFQKFYESYVQPISGDPRPGTYDIIVLEIDTSIEFDNVTIESYKTNHNADSIAYKFVEEGKIMVISGDTDYDDNLARFAENSDVLILECSFPNNQKVKGHLVSRECGELAQKANVRKLVLSHLYPIFSDAIRLNEAAAIFPNTILAEDLMTINI